MTRITAAATLTRPASSALEHRLAAGWSDDSLDTAALDALALEQARLGVEIARQVGRTGSGTMSLDDLEASTVRIAELLSKAEEVRVARAWATARRAGDEARWAEYLDLD